MKSFRCFYSLELCIRKTYYNFINNVIKWCSSSNSFNHQWHQETFINNLIKWCSSSNSFNHQWHQETWQHNTKNKKNTKLHDHMITIISKLYVVNTFCNVSIAISLGIQLT
jgi:hypothetical protein